MDFKLIHIPTMITYYPVYVAKKLFSYKMLKVFDTGACMVKYVQNRCYVRTWENGKSTTINARVCQNDIPQLICYVI